MITVLDVSSFSFRGFCPCFRSSLLEAPVRRDASPLCRLLGQEVRVSAFLASNGRRPYLLDGTLLFDLESRPTIWFRVAYEASWHLSFIFVNV